MELSANPVENGVVISIKGELDAVTGPELTNFFKEQMAEQKNLIANFSKVNYISSAGLRVLLATVKETRRMGGDLRLANVQENVNKVLKISGFISILKIFPDTNSAIKSFSE
jgi:anti-sigma B factor antagonist